MDDSSILDAARAWLAADPDPVTAAELRGLLARHDLVALHDRFDRHLTFGTAGLRGELGAGSNRMNRVIVRRAARGLVEVLPDDATIVIGFDARHNSDHFAADTATIVASAGRRALLLPRRLPTPVLAFAVRHLCADAGVMVTASHNPPRDNGYKVYLGDGAQIIPPTDNFIEASIESAGLQPRDLPAASHGGSVQRVDDTLVDAYLDATLGLTHPRADITALRVVYTPLHGVGRDVALRALARVGCTPHVVAEQAEPDPDFPTVAFPNPEEPGALDLALALACDIDADLVIANDPDADRLCVAVRRAPGEYVVLPGDDLGVLLGDHRLRTTSGPDRLVVTTVVSSSMLSKLAAHAGVQFTETLTGFKWVVRPAIDDPHLQFVFGYEEALGYTVNDIVRDKDGISAAVATLEMFADLRAAGSSPLQRLDELAEQFGRHRRGSTSVRFTGTHAGTDMAASMATLRAAPPSHLGEHRVVEVVDYQHGHDGLPPTDLLRLILDDGTRVQLRPSGTEPKLKVYVEMITSTGARDGGPQEVDDLVKAVAALVSP